MATRGKADEGSPPCPADMGSRGVTAPDGAVVTSGAKGGEQAGFPVPDRETYAEHDEGAYAARHDTLARQQPRATRPPLSTRLIADTPLRALVMEMDNDIAVLRELAPSSAELKALAYCRKKLHAALQEAAALDVWVSTKEAARVRRCTTQAITYLCREGHLLARKSSGQWEVHRDSLQGDRQRSR
jgi:hypothetical protein